MKLRMANLGGTTGNALPSQSGRDFCLSEGRMLEKLNEIERTGIGSPAFSPGRSGLGSLARGTPWTQFRVNTAL